MLMELNVIHLRLLPKSKLFVKSLLSFGGRFLLGCFFSSLSYGAVPSDLMPQTSGEDSLAIEISDEIYAFLAQGIELPVQFKLIHADIDAETYEPNGVAFIKASGDGVLSISEFNFDKQYQKTLSDELLALLSKDALVLGRDGRAEIGNGTNVRLDLAEMTIIMDIDSSDLGGIQSTSPVAKPASEEQAFSMLTNYNINAYSSGATLNSLSDYNISTSFNNVVSYEESHIRFSNFAALSSDNEVTHELDSLVFARDYDGLRTEVGMDTNAPQRVGTVSNFSVDRLYYASITNAADSILTKNGSASLIPLIVSMPATGEVRVYKNDRLIHIATLNIGRHTLDTTSFPSGVYEVKVETVIAGQVRDTKTYRVNKPANGHGGAQWVWQLWAGDAEHEQLNAQNENVSDYSDAKEGSSEERAAVGGVNLSSTFGEVTWDANLYRNPTSWVAEVGSGWQATDWLSFDGQWMKSAQGGHRALYQVNISPEWGPTLTITSERGQDDEDEYQQTRSYGVDQAQLSVPLPEQIPGGSLNLGYNIDREYDEHSWNIDYTQSLFDYDLFSLSLDTGLDRTLGEEATTNYYVSLNASLAMGGAVDIGMSEQNGTKTASFSAGMGLDGFFNYVSIDAQGELADEHIESPSTSLRTSYENGYVSGSASIGLSQDNVSLSNSSSGTLAFNSDGIAPGVGGGESGFMVVMPNYIEDKELEFMVDGTPTPLHAGANFVAAQPYIEHDVTVQVTNDAQASYDVLTEDELFTLYPGNVSTIKPVVKQMVTVFGRLVDESGTAIANASIKNHIGETVTDAQGAFSIDVDASIPEVEVDSSQTGTFKVAMAIPAASGGVVRLKDLVWSPHKSDVYLINPLL
ncbi:hypothetical protein CK911_01355 [Aeromonas sp. CU5]|uniref:CS1-pili formation C-terminal domain-containing protein n=1 Tax=Aeromonas sp. CU5 TaxID=2033033 RepID=UPI000BFEA5F1|nr:CS1-pili formation C-terminal domain-containing protein [Aeromonas sp. CU5]ATL91585.1 hypothetical protein CK911_01355 [Aeromonas sp. CU5]